MAWPAWRINIEKVNISLKRERAGNAKTAYIEAGEPQ